MLYVLVCYISTTRVVLTNTCVPLMLPTQSVDGVKILDRRLKTQQQCEITMIIIYSIFYNNKYSATT